jgi:cytochrome c-type biogenesis protein CcmH
MSTRIDQLKQQLRQLADLFEGGALTEDQHQAAKAKLERQLVDAVLAGETASPVAPLGTGSPAATAATLSTAPEPTPAVSRQLLWGMLAFIVAVGAGGYAWVGNPGALQTGPGSAGMQAGASGQAASSDAADSPASTPHAMGTDQISAMVSSLADKLKTDPNNAEGWAMLARSHAVLGQFDKAVPAYKKALSLRANDAQLLADYADALAVTQGRKLEGEPAKLIAQALAIDPANFKALSLSGTIAFDKQDFKAAAALWERALQHLPADNPALGSQMKEALNDARQRAGLPPSSTSPVSLDAALAPSATASQAASTAVVSATVSGTVSLAKSLAGKVSPEDTVFIFAKATQGPKMPLAILRKQVKDLPLSFSLDDSQAMSPQTRLSGFAEVVVGARVSKSGEAMPQPGDLQGQSAPVKLGATGVQVEIGASVR